MQTAEYYSFDRKELLPFIPKNIKKSLDVGCASGAFSAKLKEIGNTESWGIEMVKDMAEMAQLRMDKVLIGSFDDVYEKLPKQYFDCVFFNDVLEHMVDPGSCLTKIKNCLNDKGCIVASIPNIRYVDVLKELLFKKEWEYKDSGILDRTHLRFFTQKSIVRMFHDCGYTIKSIDGINGVGKRSLTSIANVLLFNAVNDLKYKQFVIVAVPAK